MAFTRLLRNLMPDEGFGARVVPIIPDEARTFGMDSLSAEVEIYATPGQLYEPVDANLCSPTPRPRTARSSRRASPRPARWPGSPPPPPPTPPAACRWCRSTSFYSMFGFQRVGDLIWSAADMAAASCSAPPPAATLLGEGLQHQDGHSLCWPPPCRPARPTTRRSPTRWRYHRGRHRACTARTRFLLPHALQRELPDAAHARRRCTTRTLVEGLYKWADVLRGHKGQTAPAALRTANTPPAALPGSRPTRRRRRPVVGHELQALRGTPSPRALEPAPHPELEP